MVAIERALFALVGFGLSLWAMAAIYGPSDDRRVVFGIVCLAVIFGNLLDSLLAWVIRAMCDIRSMFAEAEA